MYQTLGFIGLGRMGFPMALHLPKVCKRLILWNRTFEKASLCERKCSFDNVSAVKELHDLAEAELIFTCLPSSDEVETVVHYLKDKLKPGTLLVDCTSGNPSQSRELEAVLKAVGCSMIGTPLSGGPRGAENGILSVTAGGTEENVKRALPALETFCSTFIRIGDDVGSGHAVKAMNNILNTAHLFIATEAVLALSKEGIDTEKAIAAINASSGSSNITQKRFPERIFTRTFDHGFSLRLMTKDVDNAMKIVRGLSSTCEGKLPCELLETVVAKTHEALDELGPEVDYTEIVKHLEQRCGVNVK